MMNFDETNIRVLDDEDDNKVLCSYAAEQIRAYLKTFGQLPKDKQVFTHPDTDCYYIHIEIIDPIENMIFCFIDYSAG
jgi:hypothetical protein|tara:strand:+ start:890 stop:1123 length:234 start_codon:yes stop_codon:yes gene_type:complete